MGSNQLTFERWIPRMMGWYGSSIKLVAFIFAEASDKLWPWQVFRHIVQYDVRRLDSYREDKTLCHCLRKYKSTERCICGTVFHLDFLLISACLYLLYFHCAWSGFGPNLMPIFAPQMHRSVHNQLLHCSNVRIRTIS